MERQTQEDVLFTKKMVQRKLNKTIHECIKNFLVGELDETQFSSKLEETLKLYMSLAEQRRKQAVTYLRHQLSLGREDKASSFCFERYSMICKAAEKLSHEKNATIIRRKLQTEINNTLEGFIEIFLDCGLYENVFNSRFHNLTIIYQKNVMARRQEALTLPKDELLILLNKKSEYEENQEVEKEEILQELHEEPSEVQEEPREVIEELRKELSEVKQEHQKELNEVKQQVDEVKKSMETKKVAEMKKVKEDLVTAKKINKLLMLSVGVILVFSFSFYKKT